MSGRRNPSLLNGCTASLNGGQFITSTGNHSLDQIIGGGLPVGSVILIEEDRYSSYSKVICRHYLAEGLNKGHGLFLMSLDENPNDFIRTVPKPCEVKESQAKTAGSRPQGDDMRIAFRYNQLPELASEVSTQKVYYDLSTCVTPEDLSQHQLHCHDNADTFLARLREISSLDQYSQSDGIDQNLLRICVQSLGSPLWYSDENFSKKLLLHLLQLKAMVRNTNAVCLVTMPGHLLATVEPHLMEKCRNFVDISIELESFAASAKETNPVFKDYHGLIHVKKIAALDMLSAFCPDTLDLGFKLRRKKFAIEKLHLPPELGDDNSGKSKAPTMSCGSGGGGNMNNLDF